MKKSLLLLILCTFLAGSKAFSQNYPRTENPNYMQTRLYDDFTTAPLNRNIWNVTSHALREGTQHRNLFIWVDSIATVNINERSGDLTLCMLSYPNYTTTDNSIPPQTITANFIAGEVSTKEYYSYGIYECSANFSFDHGSFPAFWTMSGEPCATSFNNEIDIVELKFRKQSPAQTLDNNIFYYSMPCGSPHSPFPNSVIENEFNWGTSQTHIFKCVWTPSKIEFWVDDTQLQEFYNTGQEWYPQLPQHVILSQQIIDYNNDSPGYGIVTPQASLFHWVKVREFFLAPEITLSSNIICSTGTAAMDVDPAATNISWALTPANLFNGATTGTGTTANITPSSANHGKGKITYSFNMPSGEMFTAEKEIWINGPDYSEVSFDVYRSDGTHAAKVGNTWIMCPNTTYHIYVVNSSPVPLSNYTWTIPSAWTRFYTYQNMISVNTNSLPGGPVSVSATNTASGCNNTIQIITGYMGSSYSCGSYFMTFTPNPATTETTVELSVDGDKILTEDTHWELEVYDQQQGLKGKKTNVKGKQTKINTTGWKDGTYIVRALIGEDLISDKLVVKH